MALMGGVRGTGWQWDRNRPCRPARFGRMGYRPAQAL